MTKDKIYDFGELGRYSKTTIMELKKERRISYSFPYIQVYIDFIEEKYHRKKRRLENNIKEIEDIKVNKLSLFNSKIITIKKIHNKLDKLEALEYSLNYLIKSYREYKKVMGELSRIVNKNLREKYWQR